MTIQFTPEIYVATDTVKSLVAGINEIHTYALELTERKPDDTQAEALLVILSHTLDKLAEADLLS